MTWAHTTLASDLQPINLHCSIFLTHLREPQQLGRKVTLLLPQENAFLFSKSTKKVSSTAATSLWNPSKDLFKLTLDKHYVSVTPTFFLTTWATPQKELGKQNEGSHHAMVQHSILQRRVMVVLTIQILADHLNVSLLAHLFWRFHAKTDVASRTRNFRCMHGHIMQNHL